MVHDARLWEKVDDSIVKCGLCGHRCVIKEGEFGFCHVRRNIGGELKTLNYGKLIASNVDPIEKKPLYHFLPGSMALSIAAAGCNFRCPFCQNWQISQIDLSKSRCPGQEATPEQIVQLALEQHCNSISYTYTEPTIFFEMAYDTAVIAKEKGIKNTFVSNGYMTPEAVRKIAPYLDAINVDLKAFREDTYKKMMKAKLSAVLECLETIVQEGIWLEVTTLVVPGMNDTNQELRDLADFIAQKLGTHVPWHVSRFHGDYKMLNKPSTPLSTMSRAVTVGRAAGLKFIYCGNIPGQVKSNTNCTHCGKMLIERAGFHVMQNTLVKGKCGQCKAVIEGVWE